MIFDGVPVNVTLLFSREHYMAAAEAYLRGVERRIKAGLDPKVESVASLFVSRWDVLVKADVHPQLHNRLGIAIAMRTYKAYRDRLASERWRCSRSPTTARLVRPCQPMAGMRKAVLDEFKHEGVDAAALAARLQSEGVQAFAKSWSGLMARIREKSLQPKAARAGAA